MSKSMNARKETRKKPAMSLKEKRAAKHEKKLRAQGRSVTDLTAPEHRDG